MNTEYSIEELERADRQSVETVNEFAEVILSERTIEQYLDDNVLGNSVKALYKDVLTPFVEYLKERSEYYKVDLILRYCEEYEKN